MDVARAGEADRRVPRDHPPTRPATLRAPAWHGRVVVVSPHLDDAVLSLGASIRAATRRGARVDVLTVLAGDPASASAGTVSRLRREEDRAACRRIGAQPTWLPLSDEAGAKATPEEVRAHLAPALDGYHAVLIPGSPLAHADHRLVSRAALEVAHPGVILGIYVEQPYASWDAFALNGRPSRGRSPTQSLQALGLAVSGEPSWHHRVGRAGDWLAKTRSMGEYASQLKILRRLPRARILGYEALHRGESVIWATLD